MHSKDHKLTFFIQNIFVIQKLGFQSGSWNGSRNKLDRTLIEDIDVIIQFCSSTHWAERKDGLTSLTQYLSDGKYLTQDQLKVEDLKKEIYFEIW